MATFTEKELHIYEAEIRKKPLVMLYRERNAIKNDSSPDRQNIVKARIAALEDRERRIAEAEQKRMQKILDMPQPMPDKRGLYEYLFVIAGTFLFIIVEFWSNTKDFSISFFFNVRFLALTKYFPAIGIFFLYSRYLPIFRTILWEEKDPPNSNDVPSYWLRNYKIALCIASYFFFFAIETFVRGDYNGFFYSCAGLPAYIIGASYLISSILFITNTFYPLTQKFRPKHGLTLLAFAAVTEAIVSAIFG